MIRKIAVFSDVHGNLSALKAVLQDASENGVTDYWFLGDLFLPGPGADDLYETMLKVHPSIWLQGNWEQSINETVDRKGIFDDASDVYFSRLTEYLMTNLKTEYYNELIQRPISTSITINGLNFGLSHNQADRSTGHDLFPAQEQQNFDHLADKYDVVLYGHTHQQIMRTSSTGELIINPGAAGQPYSPYKKFMLDQRAHYTIIEVDGMGRVMSDFRKVTYDIDKEIAFARGKDLPYVDLYEHLRRTGKTITHNLELLEKVNKKYKYEKEVHKYFLE